MKKSRFLLPILLLIAVLTGCAGKALPEGMDEEALLAAGREVLLLAVDGDYEGVHAMLREDQRELYTPEDIRTMVLANVDGAGVYKQITDSMATGQTEQGEHFGIAVLYCEYAKDDVLFRVAFDSDMNLIGLSVKKQ